MILFWLKSRKVSFFFLTLQSKRSTKDNFKYKKEEKKDDETARLRMKLEIHSI